MNVSINQQLHDTLVLLTMMASDSNSNSGAWSLLYSGALEKPLVYPSEDQLHAQAILRKLDGLLAAPPREATPFRVTNESIEFHASQPWSSLPVSEDESFKGQGLVIGLFDQEQDVNLGVLITYSEGATQDQFQQSLISRIARLFNPHLKKSFGDKALAAPGHGDILLEEIARQTSNGIVLADTEGRVIWVNAAFESITGYSLENMVGKKPGEVLQGEETSSETVAYMRRQLACRKGFDAELINYHRNGHAYWVRLRCEPLFSSDGRHLGFTAIQQDIDNDKRNQMALQRSENISRAVLETLHEAVVMTDIQGRILISNPMLERIFGYPRDALLGANISKLMPEEVARAHPSWMASYANAPERSGSIMGSARKLQGLRADGTIFPLRIAVTEADVEGERMLVAAMQDITDSEKTRAALRQFQETLDQTLDCVFMFDAQTLRFIYANQGAIDQLGYTREELLQLHPFDIKPDYSEAQFRNLIVPLVDGSVKQLDFKTVHVGKNATLIPVEIKLQYVLLQGANPRFVAIVRDITEQEQQLRKIERLAWYDSLTGLPNRAHVRRELEKTVAACAASGTLGAVLLLDLDDFKLINDTLGHRSGDELLQELAERFRSVVADQGICARLGGDEFMIVLTRLPFNRALRAAITTARSLLAEINTPSLTLGVSRGVSASLGLVMFKDDTVPVSELMRRADIAMYDAKHKGKNRFSVFDEAMLRKLEEEQAITAELKAALARGEEIEPWFQAKVGPGGRITGFEALVRWRHPKRGLLGPGQFVPLAEKKNLIIMLGELVLRKACEYLRQWRETYRVGDWTVAVNISQSQLAQPGFADRVEDILREAGLPASALRLEVTESTVAQDIDVSIERMKQLKALGVAFSLDDFGTGYSSLSYLQQLPIDELKIDRSFVRDLAQNPEGHAIVEAIVDLAGILKLSVIAEGVENTEEWQALLHIGCKAFQGYWFSVPLAPENIPVLIEHHVSGGALPLPV